MLKSYFVVIEACDLEDMFEKSMLKICKKIWMLLWVLFMIHVSNQKNDDGQKKEQIFRQE